MRAGAMPLLGREAELQPALDALAHITAGTGRTILIEGEAGIGKTRLADEIVRHAERHGLHIARGGGRDLEVDLPFAPFVEALRLHPDDDDARRAAAGQALAEPVGQTSVVATEMPEHRLHVTQLVLDLVEDLCGDGPMAVIIEDAHCVDRASMAIMARLASRIAHLPLLLVITARPYPRSSDMDALVGSLLSAGADHVCLAALDEEAVTAIAKSLLDARPGEQLVTELRAAAGNPLFVTELLSALHAEGALDLRDGTVEIRCAQLPPSLRLTILRRISVLPEQTVELLRMAAILGTTFQPSALAAVVDQPQLEIIRALEPARQAALVMEAGPHLAFRHDLVRDAVYGDLPEAVRRALHATVADALRRAGYPAEMIAPHLLRSADTGDTETVGKLRELADALRLRAPDVAIELLGRAVRLAGPKHRDHDELRVELAEAMRNAQRTQDAAAVLDEVLADIGGGALRRRALSARASLALLLGGTSSFALELEDAASEADVSPAERCRLLAAAASAWLELCDYERAEARSLDALREAESVGDDIAMCLALRTLAESIPLHDERTTALARRAVHVARRCPVEERHLVLTSAELALACDLGDQPGGHDEAIALARGALARSERLGLPEDALEAQICLGIELYRDGRWEEARSELEAGVTRAAELGRSYDRVAAALCRLARIAVHDGDLVGAQEWLDRVDRLIATSLDLRGSPHLHAALARAWYLDATGEQRSAFDLLVSTYQATPPAHRLWAALSFAVLLVRLACELGHPANDVVREMTEMVPEDDSLWLSGLINANPAAVLAAIDRKRTLGSYLREDLPMCLEDASRLLVQHDRPAEAVPLLKEASAIWADMGAVRNIERLEAKLRDLGVRRGKVGSRRRPAIGWDALTETEERVLALVVDGMTYREVGETMFISRRTVETHVAHVFAKVGVANRGELKAAYAVRAEQRPGFRLGKTPAGF